MIAQRSATHRLNVFIAGSSDVSEGTDQSELSVEIVGWLHVVVGDLSQYLLVVVNHVSPVYLSSGLRDSPLQI